MAPVTITIETTLHEHAQPTVISVAQDEVLHPWEPTQAFALASGIAKLLTKHKGDGIAALLSLLPTDD